MSPDLAATNLERLKALFPELVTEGPEGTAVNVDVLKALVGDKTVSDADEKYGLNWHGKRQARQLALKPSTGTLRPCPEESVDWETTQNLMIEGDNLEVLKLLQKSYAGKVKLIYIDPPYNTGIDFVYPDDFRDSIKNYLELTGQTGSGRALTSNADASGRFHTDWLNMMYPRLVLARNLLRDDGLIFISIDDGEAGHLRTLTNEVFGPENFVGNAVWQKAYTANMTAAHISNTHDHILIYAKDSTRASMGKVDRSEEQKSKFANPDNDPRGPWKAENLSAGKFYSAGQYEIEGPTGLKFSPPQGRYWRCNEDQYEAWLADNRITFGKSGQGRPMLKKFLAEAPDGLTPSTWWRHEDFGSNKEASIELKALFDGEACFQTPKPVKLLRKICNLATESNSIVLDFFAGSGTTAHAVLEANAEDGGSRRYILVQLPERLDPSDKNQKFAADTCKKIGIKPNLAELTKERLRRAAVKIKDNYSLSIADFGFRSFMLDTSNIHAWEPDLKNLDQSILDYTNNIKEGRTEEDILYELLLKLGLDLCVPIEQKEIAGKAVHSIGGGVLMACLAQEINRENVEPLAQGFITWHQALAPAGDTTCVFRDSAFTDDVAKTNLTAILNQHGITTVRSL
ncbi:putative Type III restriction enzyme/ Mod subunit (methylase) [Synechococcus sp. PROS-7-1]|nr:putative Type III restriction enzyme/ Mod subunit (methylase) [Synechococcus sp. PROS-7-1]